MKISLVSSTLGYNPMIRLYPFYEILKKHYDVQLIGPMDKNCFYKPLRNDIKNYDAIKEKKIFPFYLKTFHQINKGINGDVIHAFKPRLFSYGASLLHSLKKHKKLILDIDDWETQHFVDNYFSFNPIKLSMFLGSDFYFGEGYFGKKILEKLIKYSDRIIVDCYQLQKLFGGIYIPSGADTNFFDPSKHSGVNIRKKYGFSKDDIIVGYVGNPKKHKGVKDIIEAVNLANKENPNIKLLIVGADKNQPAPEAQKFIESLEKMNHITLEGYVPHEEVPKYLSAIDITPVPHLNFPSANKQMPYKIFEYMAMGKAIIGSDKADIPIALEKCGKIIPSGNVDSLKNAILEYSYNKKIRIHDGNKARNKCVKEYSWKVMENRILEVYQNI